VPALLIFSIAILANLKAVSQKIDWVFCLGLAGSVGLAYSVIPTAIVLASYFLFVKQKKISAFLKMVFGFLIIFAPLIFFELRHNFFFSKKIFSDGFEFASKVNYSLKLRSYLYYLFGFTKLTQVQLILVLTTTMLIFYGMVLIYKNHSQKRQTGLLLFSAIFAISFIFTLIMPFNARKHDFFAVLMLFFSMISFLPKKIKATVLVLFGLLWINPSQINNYLIPARRTINDLEQCAKIVCSVQKDKMFIATQAWHIFNWSPGHNFFFSKYGCNVKDITHNPNWTNKMALVADNAQYTHGKTSFNELTLFGNSKVKDQYQCPGNIKVYILQRN
jgi:hypothetical protein